MPYVLFQVWIKVFFRSKSIKTFSSRFQYPNTLFTPIYNLGKQGNYFQDKSNQSSSFVVILKKANPPLVTKKAIIASLVLISACGDSVQTTATEIASNKYYESEIIPDKYSDFYGKWKATSMSGGLAGSVVKPDFDFLVIQQFGIYEIIQNEQVVE